MHNDKNLPGLNWHSFWELLPQTGSSTHGTLRRVVVVVTTFEVIGLPVLEVTVKSSVKMQGTVLPPKTKKKAIQNANLIKLKFLTAKIGQTCIFRFWAQTARFSCRIWLAAGTSPK